MTTEQFCAKSPALKEAGAVAESELEAARSYLTRFKDIERSKDALVSHYASGG